MSLPPSQPDVTDYNERSMTLRWRPPIDDGGMKITAYNIEAKTQGDAHCNHLYNLNLKCQEFCWHLMKQKKQLDVKIFTFIVLPK